MFVGHKAEICSWRLGESGGVYSFPRSQSKNLLRSHKETAANYNRSNITICFKSQWIKTIHKTTNRHSWTQVGLLNSKVRLTAHRLCYLGSTPYHFQAWTLLFRRLKFAVHRSHASQSFISPSSLLSQNVPVLVFLDCTLVPNPSSSDFSLLRTPDFPLKCKKISPTGNLTATVPNPLPAFQIHCFLFSQ